MQYVLFAHCIDQTCYIIVRNIQAQRNNSTERYISCSKRYSTKHNIESANDYLHMYNLLKGSKCEVISISFMYIGGI